MNKEGSSFVSVSSWSSISLVTLARIEERIAHVEKQITTLVIGLAFGVSVNDEAEWSRLLKLEVSLVRLQNDRAKLVERRRLG